MVASRGGLGISSEGGTSASPTLTGVQEEMGMSDDQQPELGADAPRLTLGTSEADSLPIDDLLDAMYLLPSSKIIGDI